MTVTLKKTIVRNNEEADCYVLSSVVMSGINVCLPGSARRSLFHPGLLPARVRSSPDHPGRDPRHHRVWTLLGQRGHDMSVTSQTLPDLYPLSDIYNSSSPAPASGDLRDKLFVWRQRSQEIITSTLTQSNGIPLDCRDRF